MGAPRRGRQPSCSRGPNPDPGYFAAVYRLGRPGLIEGVDADFGEPEGPVARAGGHPPARLARFRRRRGKVLAVLAVAVFSLLIASAVLFVFPASDHPRHADAILSLNGENEAAREALSISLARRGFAPVLLFSQGNSHTTPCPAVQGVRVICFEARPDRTAGEVEFATRLAHRSRWTSLLMVPGRAQATRARMLLERCFSGRITVVPAPVPVLDEPYQIAYEWGALAKALVVDRHC